MTTYPFNVLEEKFSNINGHPSSKGDVAIGNDVWIGRDTLILSGVSVGDGAVIAARSVVTKNVKPYEVVGGNPIKHIKFRFDETQINTLLKIRWWDLSRTKIEKLIPCLLSNDFDGFIQRYEEVIKIDV